MYHMQLQVTIWSVFTTRLLNSIYIVLDRIMKSLLIRLVYCAIPIPNTYIWIQMSWVLSNWSTLHDRHYIWSRQILARINHTITFLAKPTDAQKKNTKQKVAANLKPQASSNQASVILLEYPTGPDERTPEQISLSDKRRRRHAA